MRIVHALSILLAVAAIALLAGCGGGGGPTPPDNSNGVVTIETTQQQVVYTPPAGREIYSVFAYFTNVENSSQMVGAIFQYDPVLQKWILDYSDGSDDFSGAAIGNYYMEVKVIFMGDVDAEGNPITRKVGNTLLMENLAVIGGNGPPPPPWP